MTITYEAVAATGSLYELAEGVLWDDRAQRVRWVDIWKGRVLSGVLEDSRITNIDEILLGQSAGAVALAADGGLLIAASRGLAAISADGVVSIGPDLLGDRVDVRFNDGSVDPYGAFVAGTLAVRRETGEEVLLRIQPDGTVETLRERVRLSNGIGFSPDGGTIYHVDTLAGTVASHSYGPGSFDLSEPWVTMLDGFPAFPDGLTVDSDGALWVAQWGGASVRCHSSTGELLAVVSVNAAQASCPGFVGAGLDTLAITSAREGLGSVTDQAGAIFLAEVDSTGLPSPLWAGSTITPSWLNRDREEEEST